MTPSTHSLVAPVRLAAHALAHEAGALGVAHRALVEAVDLELEAVEAEVEDQVALEEPRRVVGEPAAPEVRVDRERRRGRRSGCAGSRARSRIVPRARRRPRSRRRRTPPARPRERSISARSPSRSRGPDRGEERLDLLVGHELDEEVDVVAAGPRGSRRSRRLRRGRLAAREAHAPEPSATPAEDQREPAERRGGQRLVEEQRAVDERERRASGT